MDALTIPASILTAGNHLANQLIAMGLPIEDKNAGYWDVLARRGEVYADIWTCWAAIMQERDGHAKATTR